MDLVEYLQGINGVGSLSAGLNPATWMLQVCPWHCVLVCDACRAPISVLGVSVIQHVAASGLDLQPLLPLLACRSPPQAMQLSWESTLLTTMRPAPCGSERPCLHDWFNAKHNFTASSMQPCFLHLSVGWVRPYLMGRAC